MSGQRILDVRDLTKHFPIKKGFFQKTVGHVKAVDGVSFFLNKGESIGLVGESGCGKSTAARAIMRLVEPTSGSIVFQDQDICTLSHCDLRKVRKSIQIIFQDPYSSLNPRQNIGAIVGEPMDIYKTWKTRQERRDRIAYLLEKVGLKSDHADRYPHEFSGGQRQRICVARALALNPMCVIGDEPVSALDVSVQAQIINLMEDLQKEFDLSYIIISHDLAVVEHMCDRIMVMYLGRIVESARDVDIIKNPVHPYTRALLSAVLEPDPDHVTARQVLKGDVPSPSNPPPGCHFHTRCPECEAVCRREKPETIHLGNGHYVACHRVAASRSPGSA